MPPLRRPSEQLLNHQLLLSRAVLPAESRIVLPAPRGENNSVVNEDAVEPFTDSNANEVDDAAEEEPACDVAANTDEETEDVAAANAARGDNGAAHPTVDARVVQDGADEVVAGDVEPDPSEDANGGGVAQGVAEEPPSEASAELVIADQMEEATTNGQHLLALMLKVNGC